MAALVLSLGEDEPSGTSCPGARKAGALAGKEEYDDDEEEEVEEVEEDGIVVEVAIVRCPNGVNMGCGVR